MKGLGTKSLESERLILRKYKISDAKDMHENWGTDPNCNIFLPWELHKNIEESKEIISKWIDSYDDDTYKWIIESKVTNEAIGGIDVVKLRKLEKNCEVGYCIGSKFWGNGYATEALKTVIEYLFNECDLYLIAAAHHEGNPASGRVMQKAGMIKECSLRKRVINRLTGELDNLIYYSIIKDEFLDKNKEQLKTN